MAYAPTRELAHEMMDRMAPAQVPVAVELLVKMLDPVTLALANAPFEDEAISADEELDARRRCPRPGRRPRWKICWPNMA